MCVWFAHLQLTKKATGGACGLSLAREPNAEEELE